MRHDPVDLGTGDANFLHNLVGDLGQLDHGVAEDLAPLHPQEAGVLGGRWAARDIEKVVMGAVGVQADAQDAPVCGVAGAEDFSFMLHAKPGSYIWMGNGAGEGGCYLHNPHYDFNDEALPLGASYWATLVESLLPKGKS